MSHDFKNLMTIEHPLVQHMITKIRRVETEPHVFRTQVRKIAELLGYEALRDASIKNQEILTPVETMHAPTLRNPNICFVSILRAGNGLLDGLLDLYPAAAVGYVGLRRNEETLVAELYYKNLPPDVSQRHVIVCDPMLATGGSASQAIEVVKQANPLSIKLLSLVSAPEGVRTVAKDHPDVPVITGALDSHLNEKGYIVPGLGDAGDRLYGTVVES